MPRAFAAIRAELEVPADFPAEVLAAAVEAAGRDAYPDEREDLRAVDFLTIDPPGSMDLDQALHLSRRDGGYRLRYAIADVAAVAGARGGARRGGQAAGGDACTARTGALRCIPRACPRGRRPCCRVRCARRWCGPWTSTPRAKPQAVDVSRALVRSARRWTYAEVQAALGAGEFQDGDRPWPCSPRLGPLREARERERGGVSLPIPEQEVEQVEGGYRLSYRVPLPVEGWNAQISLLTGMVAADLMLHGEVGVLRTLPDAPAGALAALRRTARALGVAWPAEVTYPELVHSLDHRDPAAIALVQESTSLLRGAGYVAFDGTLPEVVRHSAVAAPYAHVTAPLRRLVDRFGLEVCVALCQDRDIPDWVRLRAARAACADESRRCAGQAPTNGRSWTSSRPWCCATRWVESSTVSWSRWRAMAGAASCSSSTLRSGPAAGARSRWASGSAYGLLMCRSRHDRRTSRWCERLAARRCSRGRRVTARCR